MTLSRPLRTAAEGVMEETPLSPSWLRSPFPTSFPGRSSSISPYVKEPFWCSDGCESACNVGDPGSIPGLGRSHRGQTAWQPTPVLLPRESHGKRNLAGYSPWDRKESDRTESDKVQSTLKCYGSKPFHFYRCWHGPEALLICKSLIFTVALPGR
ncbi:unnamed protein product [Rangifer tarandus platyrhynchus]|uniref:Uncharacterized protein n=2 Tax=Rangifer tarandus platyrhynchus TaxID=3082113 RepID=A0AC59ZKR3_RANTA|nr:unnamed protein product [Rangifer tarandus platyrhynchus]